MILGRSESLWNDLRLPKTLLKASHPTKHKHNRIFTLLDFNFDQNGRKISKKLGLLGIKNSANYI